MSSERVISQCNVFACVCIYVCVYIYIYMYIYISARVYRMVVMPIRDGRLSRILLARLDETPRRTKGG